MSRAVAVCAQRIMTAIMKIGRFQFHAIGVSAKEQHNTNEIASDIIRLVWFVFVFIKLQVLLSVAATNVPLIQ